MAIRRSPAKSPQNGGSGIGPAPPVVHDVLASPGQPLPASARSFMEPRFGRDFGEVQLHRGTRAAESARALRAAAFTTGSHIVFGRGRFDPESGAGKRLLAHELTHVVQQSSCGATTMPTAGARLVARTPGDDDTAAREADPPTLSNARFTGNRVLERVLSGEIEALSAEHDGRRGAVAKVQQALVALGFELPIYRADGSYGAETEEAIRQFRARYGPSEGSQLDGPALAVLDRVAPPPGDIVEHTVDYDRLLADGRLDVTVAIGTSDEMAERKNSKGEWVDTDTPVEAVQAEQFRKWMRANGFDLELSGPTSSEYWKATRSITWTVADGTEKTREIDIWIQLVVPGAGAAYAYGRGLSNYELTLYMGHARYGSGPDFDAIDSAVENFRFGVDTALSDAGRSTSVEEATREGVALDAERDLVEMVSSGDFDPDRYRLLFFQACTTIAYLDEIRDQMGGPENIDVIGTRDQPLFSNREGRHIGTPEIQRLLEGILAAESIESILAGLEEIQTEFHSLAGDKYEMPRGGLYFSSGRGGNPIAP